MSKNISNACCKLVGLSCLSGSVKDRVWQQWNSRFHEHEAFWVDVQSEQTASGIAQTITQKIAQQGIMSLAGQTLVMGVFLDLTQEPNEELVKQIVQVPMILKNVLGCTVPLTMEFGFLDKMAFADKQILRSNAKQIVQLNNINPQERKQLCLIATSPLVQEEEDNSWKAAMTLLDVLRRVSDPATFVPVGGGGNPNDDIGFIRYGEYNAKKVQKLGDEKAQLTLALGSGGETELKTAINLALAKIENDIDARYTVDGNSQPLHPHMMVEGFFAKKAAAKGKDSKFNAARNATWSALEMTGRGLCNMITEDYRSRIDNAAAELARFIAEVGVGIELEADTQLMEGILKPERLRVPEPMAPGLTYSESGYAEEIGIYLKNVRHYGAAKVKQAYAQALYDAYMAIDASVFAEKRAKLTKEMASVNIRLNSVLSKEEFINMVASEAPLRQTGFFPVLGGGTGISCVLCRNRQDEDALNQVCSSKVLYIDEKFGGIKVLDEAPITALQLLLFDCDDQRLEDLIK